MLVHVQDIPNQFDVHFFEEGYVKISGMDYDMEDEKIEIHCTNFRISKEDKLHFNNLAEGNTLSLQ